MSSCWPPLLHFIPSSESGSSTTPLSLWVLHQITDQVKHPGAWHQSLALACTTAATVRRVPCSAYARSRSADIAVVTPCGIVSVGSGVPGGLSEITLDFQMRADLQGLDLCHLRMHEATYGSCHMTWTTETAFISGLTLGNTSRIFPFFWVETTSSMLPPMNRWTFCPSVPGVARVSLTGTDWGNALTHSVGYFVSVLHSILLLSLTHLLYVLLLNCHLFVSTASLCPSSIFSFSFLSSLFYSYLFITLHPSVLLSAYHSICSPYLISLSLYVSIHPIAGPFCLSTFSTPPSRIYGTA